MHHAHAGDPALWTLLGLGAYHGLNPAMGWLFAVALGMQERDRRAIARTVAALAIGHAVAVAAILAIAGVAGVVLPAAALRWTTAIVLVGLGCAKLVSSKHPRFGGMRIGFRDLVIWSCLMASAHGAGLMLLPVVLRGGEAVGLVAAGAATVVHTFGYLATTALVATVVFEKVGIGFLRRGWLNVDLAWSLALVVAGVATVLV